MRRLSLLLVAVLLVSRAHTQPVVLGIDHLVSLETRQLLGKRLGIVTNQTGRTGDGRRSIDALRAVHGVNLMAIFSPEHGLAGTTPAGTAVPGSRDSASGVPVYSLYGLTHAPSPAVLHRLDVLIYDVQDIGVRSYTFISTLGEVMRACAAARVHLIVCDRPMVMGDRCDGPVLDTTLRSFVGMYPIPYVYGLTVGELARMINGERWMGPRCDLTVMPLLGYRRTMTWDETGVPWIPTSPNVPSPSTVAYCAAFGAAGELGAGYMGIGSPDAFRVLAQPHLPRAALVAWLRAHPLRGVSWSAYDTVVVTREGRSLPETGVRWELRLDSIDDLFAAGMHLLAALRAVDALSKPDPARVTMFTKVCGTELFDAIWSGIDLAADTTRWHDAHQMFRARRAPYLLYP